MKKIRFLAIILLLGCVQKSAIKYEAGYFDVELICQQLSRLMQGATVEKTIKMSNQTTSFVKDNTDTAFWRDELLMLKACNINKPSFLGNYAIQKEGFTTTYSALKSSYPVRFLQINQSPEGELLGLKAEFATQNPLFFIRRSMEYQFENQKIVSYQVKSTKKVVLLDSLNFDVSATIKKGFPM